MRKSHFVAYFVRNAVQISGLVLPCTNATWCTDVNNCT